MKTKLFNRIISGALAVSMLLNSVCLECNAKVYSEINTDAVVETSDDKDISDTITDNYSNGSEQVEIIENSAVNETVDKINDEITSETEALTEIVEERSEYSKVYELSDFSHIAVLYDEPVHYENESGELVEIDNSIIETNDEYTNADNSYDVTFSKESNDATVTYTEDDYEISWTVEDNGNRELETIVKDIEEKESDQEPDKIHTINESTITYSGFSQNYEIEYEPKSTGVKENIILKDKNCSNSYSFEMNIKGLSVSVNAIGEAEFRDEKNGELMYYFPAPYMEDAEGNVSTDVRYVIDDTNENQNAENKDSNKNKEILTEDNYTCLITVEADKEWLSKAVYPVVIDPEIKKCNTNGIIEQGSFNSEGVTGSSLYVGKNKEKIDSVYKEVSYKSYVKFDMPEVPKQSIISDAKLYLAGKEVTSTGVTICAYALKEKRYLTNEEDGATKLTWNSDIEKGEILDYSYDTGYFDITKAVREWYEDSSSNNGLIFEAEDYSALSRSKISLRSGNKNPYLIITYRTAIGYENYYSSHQVNAGTAGAGIINDYTGALTIVNTDVDTSGNRAPMTINHVYNSNEENGNKWHINYEEKISVPCKTVNPDEYPYVYTDADGTPHYFKKSIVTYLCNGVSKTVDVSDGIVAAKDEDGLKLYIVPVTDTNLKDKYYLKLIDKSASTVKYFDKFGRLRKITDSNVYEKDITAALSDSGDKEK